MDFLLKSPYHSYHWKFYQWYPLVANDTIGNQRTPERFSAANGTIGANVTIGGNVGTNGTIGKPNGTIGQAQWCHQ